MVKPRHPSAAAAEMARRQRCALALMAAGCLSLFVITSITFHGIISDEDYADDGIAGLGVDGAANNHNRKKQAKAKLPKKRMDGDVDLNDTCQSVRDAHDERYPPLSWICNSDSGINSHSSILVDNQRVDVHLLDVWEFTCYR